MEHSTSVHYAKQIQGLCCILVILHHLSDHVDWLSFFKYTGYLPVSVFLFYSGYGLYRSALTKPGYLKKLALIRIPHIILAYLFANALYFVVRILTDTFTETSIKGFLFGGGAFVTYSWYIICLIYLYVAFFISALFLKRNKVLSFVFLLGFVALWFIMMLCTSGGVHRYNALFAFPMGCVIAEYEDIIWDNKQLNILSVVVFAVTFTGAFLLSIRNENFPIRLLCMIVASLSFAYIMDAIARAEKGNGALFTVLGQVSLEFYLYQGLVMLLLQNPHWAISNDFLFSIFVFIGTLAIAVILKRMDDTILTLWKKCLNYLGRIKTERIKQV